MSRCHAESIRQTAFVSNCAGFRRAHGSSRCLSDLVGLPRFLHFDVDFFNDPSAGGDIKKLSDPLLRQLAYLWNTTVLYASGEGKKYGDDFREVFYEALPERAASILPEIWQWLGVSHSDRLLASMPKFENRNYKWKAEFTAEETASVEEITREGLIRFGYLGTTSKGGGEGDREYGRGRA